MANSGKQTGATIEVDEGMIQGANVCLRPIRDEDWHLIERWGSRREALWGPFQRFQLDHVPQLREAYRKTGLLSRNSGFLLVETVDDRRVIGFVRYTLIQFPDADVPYPEIGFGIPELEARGKGFAREAVRLSLDYLFSAYPTERVAAFTDTENGPAQRLLEGVGFRREGILRRATYRDGRWCDIAAYAILRSEWQPKHDE